MTAPFGPVLEAALKENVQGGRLAIYSGVQVHAEFYCCVSGTSVGVAKDPVAMLFLSADRVCTGVAITADYSNSWSPSSTLSTWVIDLGDGNTSNGVCAWGGISRASGRRLCVANHLHRYSHLHRYTRGDRHSSSPSGSHRLHSGNH